MSATKFRSSGTNAQDPLIDVQVSASYAASKEVS